MHAIALPGSRPIANDVLKQQETPSTAVGIIAAVIFHLLVLAYFPDLTVADFARDSAELDVLDVVPFVQVPPPPEIARPAIPIVSTNIDIDPGITIASTHPRDYDRLDLPAPPTRAITDTGSGPAWTPFEVAPVLRNREEFARALQRRYPEMLRNAGIGGTVNLAMQLDERGVVEHVEVHASSGYAQLDEVAVQLVREIARFSPALNRDIPIAVWISLPVTFATR